MRVRMLENKRGTEDGCVVKLFIKGEIYNMCDFLARSFIAAGRARELDNQQEIILKNYEE
ncbi:MAG: hypothetical protein MK052_11000 [Alphaproteobacteria bacterium]|nr:hypothetical protein [Alphaproteobacteria bacterium]